MVCGRKEVRKGALAILNCNGFYAPSYPTTIVSDFRKQNPLGLKSVQTLCFFLKDAELIGCEIIAIDGTKAERTTVRKRTSIKEN
jgi:hypothetical protein